MKKRRIKFLAECGKKEEAYKYGMYLLEKSGDSNDEQGLFYLKLSAQQGYKPAIEYLETYYFDDDAGVQGNS